MEKNNIMNRADLAGKFMQLQSSDLFQESMEGVLAGGTAGLNLIGTGIPLSQVALQTAGAIGGGIGIGLLGKNIGAAIGKRLHPQALKNQEGLLAVFGRSAGQKTLAGGAAESLRYAKGQIKQELKQQTSSQLLNEALQNPQVFASKYGVDPETFKKYHSAVGTAGQAVAGLETLQNLSPEQRKQLGKTAQQYMDQGFNQVENLINTQAAANMDKNIAEMASRTKGKTIPGTDIDAGEMFGQLLKQPKAITGEHVGRGVGRFIGDEIGVVTGTTVGAAAAGALGIKTEKDKKIEELERQLGRRS
jgi:hypothetical protein